MNKQTPRDAETSEGMTKAQWRRIDMNSLTQKSGENFLACIDCGTPKTTPKAQKAARCHVCENKRRAAPVIDGHKICRTCGERKAKSEFSFLKNTCKRCLSAKSSIWNKNNREQKNKNNRVSRENNLDKSKERDRIYHQNNRDKRLEYNREYYKNHKSEIAQNKREWLGNNKDKTTIYSHRRRALKMSVENTLTAKEWKDIKDSYFNRCVYCGESATEQDHLIPFFSGGANTSDNVVPACKTCNVKKGKKSLLEFLYYLVKNER